LGKERRDWQRKEHGRLIKDLMNDKSGLILDETMDKSISQFVDHSVSKTTIYWKIKNQIEENSFSFRQKKWFVIYMLNNVSMAVSVFLLILLSLTPQNNPNLYVEASLRE
jgi:hypothetical protein